jgi:hypothetical protein
MAHAVDKIEAQLQQKCFLWHWNEFHWDRGMLHHNDNNSINEIVGAQKKGLGVVSGVCDLEYIFDGGICFIELKLPGRKQSNEQIEFQQKVEERGHWYTVVYSLEEFKKLIWEIMKSTGRC